MDDLWKAGQSMNCVHVMRCSPENPSLSRESPVVEQLGCWKMGFGVRTQGGDSFWL